MAAVVSSQTPMTFEERVVREARRFDLKPLLDVLQAHGYGREEILFESTDEGSSGSVVHAVRFATRPLRLVTITLNLGLLGDSSLLPSYFLMLIERSRDPERFYDFLRFFDHRLLENLTRALYVEDSGVYKDWRGFQRSFLRMLSLGSTSTLGWLAQTYFPELRTHTSRHAFATETPNHAARAGISRLDGTSVMGRVYESDAAGFKIDLFAEEEVNSRGRAWPSIVLERLDERLLPILAPQRIPLVVRLTVMTHASWTRVDFSFADEHGYLGYERLRGDPEAGHTIVMYKGITGQDPLVGREE